MKRSRRTRVFLAVRVHSLTHSSVSTHSGTHARAAATWDRVHTRTRAHADQRTDARTDVDRCPVPYSAARVRIILNSEAFWPSSKRPICRLLIILGPFPFAASARKIIDAAVCESRRVVIHISALDRPTAFRFDVFVQHRSIA